MQAARRAKANAQVRSAGDLDVELPLSFLAARFSRCSGLCCGLVFIGPFSVNAGFTEFCPQTGQPCGTCHTDFPALTPYGRRFKLLGYTTGGGQFRKTLPFPVLPESAGSQIQDDSVRAYAKAIDTGAGGDDDKAYVPPISMMAIVGFTHTQAPLPPPTSPWAPSDNTVLSPVSGFWGGAITDHTGPLPR
jgi:hypothetical protein